MRIDWKRKLSSRKFWVALMSFIVALCVLLNVDSETTERITSLIMSGGVLMSYIIAEGMVDANSDTYSEDNDNEN